MSPFDSQDPCAQSGDLSFFIWEFPRLTSTQAPFASGTRVLEGSGAIHKPSSGLVRLAETGLSQDLDQPRKQVHKIITYTLQRNEVILRPRSHKEGSR